MKINVIVLVSAAATLACLEAPSGVSGFSIAAEKDNEGQANDSLDAEFAAKSTSASNMTTNEERMMPSGNGFSNKLKAVASSIFVPKIAEPIQFGPQTIAKREAGLLADLSSPPLLNQVLSTDQKLKQYEKKYGVDVLANILVMAKEYDDVAISKRANKLFDRLIERWWKDGKTVDEVAKSLKLFDEFPRIVDGDHRKVKAVRAYLKSIYRKTKRLRTLEDVLMKNYGVSYAKRLLEYVRVKKPTGLRLGNTDESQRKLIGDWSKRQLSADDVFKELRLGDKGMLIFSSFELQALERYVHTHTNNDMLSVLVKGFGEAKFAELAYEAYALKHNFKAEKYLDLLLNSWKGKHIKPEDLAHTKFSQLISTADQDNIQEVIINRYRELYLKD